MKWEQTTPEPVEPSFRLQGPGNLHLSISRASGQEMLWQYFNFTIGRHSDGLATDLMETWPREAIRLAHEQLDEFEAKLDEADEKEEQERAREQREIRESDEQDYRKWRAS